MSPRCFPSGFAARRQGTYVLHFAASGEEALDKLANGVRPELIVILSDINMPGMDGLSLLREIKKQRPDLPVMMVTAYGDEETPAASPERRSHCRIEKKCGLLSQHYHYGAEVSQCRERAGKAFCASHWFPVLFISRPRRHGRSRSRLDSVADLRDSYVDTN